MDIKLIGLVTNEEIEAVKKWGEYDKTPEDLLCALLEEAGEVAHAINHKESMFEIEQEIIETIGILSRLWEMIQGRVKIQ